MKSCHGCWYVKGRVYAEKHVFLQYTGERASHAFYASKSGALGRYASMDSGGVTCTLRKKTTGQVAGPRIGGVGATVEGEVAGCTGGKGWRHKHACPSRKRFRGRAMRIPGMRWVGERMRSASP